MTDVKYSVAPSFASGGSGTSCGNTTSTASCPIDTYGGGGTACSGLSYGTFTTPSSTAQACYGTTMTNQPGPVTGAMSIGSAIRSTCDVTGPVTVQYQPYTGSSYQTRVYPTVSYTSPTICLQAGKTYTFSYQYGLFNYGYRSLRIDSYVSGGAGNPMALITSNSSTPASWSGDQINCGSTSTSLAKNWCDPAHDSNVHTYLGSASTGASNQSGTASGTYTPTKTGNYTFTYMFIYGPNQLCYCGCRSATNQGAVTAPTISC